LPPESQPFRVKTNDYKIAIWLPDMDLNHDKQIQSLLCYRYTIGHAGAFAKLKLLTAESSHC
jgi:hypothetical protein